MNQNETPLFDALRQYIKNDTLPFHVPGHKNGNGVDNEFKEFIGENPFKIDLTVFKSVDSLHNPTGAIKKAQELLTDLYETDGSFFAVNGTSGAIQAMILSVVKQGDKILIPRNVHKAITAGIILSGAIPVYMEPEIDTEIGIALGVTPEVIEKTLQENKDAKAVLVTNPIYYGVATDIRKVVDIVHSYDIPLIVDEAHGPHLKFTDKLPVSALEAGADMCAQSSHKLIGCLTQMSVLHVKSKYVKPKKVQQILNLLQTTSPSYILMASMDCARRQMALEGEKLVQETIDRCDKLRDDINKIPGFRCFGTEIVGKPGVFALDTTKITISSRDLGLTGHELETILDEKYHIQMDLSDFYNVLATCSFGDTDKGMERLLNALKEISKEHYGKNERIGDFLNIPKIPKMVINPRDAFNSEQISIKIEDSIGKISGEFLMAYPPGIPILCPGEEITQEVIDYVNELKRANLSVQGTEDNSLQYIKVVK